MYIIPYKVNCICDYRYHVPRFVHVVGRYSNRVYHFCVYDDKQQNLVVRFENFSYTFILYCTSTNFQKNVSNNFCFVLEYIDGYSPFYFLTYLQLRFFYLYDFFCLLTIFLDQSLVQFEQQLQALGVQNRTTLTNRYKYFR